MGSCHMLEKSLLMSPIISKPVVHLLSIQACLQSQFFLVEGSCLNDDSGKKTMRHPGKVREGSLLRGGRESFTSGKVLQMAVNFWGKVPVLRTLKTDGKGW